MFLCFLSPRIHLICKALAEIIVTKVIFLSSFLATDIIALPGLCNCFYGYILNYPPGDCNK